MCPDHYQADFLANNYSATTAPTNSLHHAFTLSFFWLLQAARSVGSDESLEALYTVAVAETVKLGGDVKSNVAIVGGMLGALIGVTRIPKSMVLNLIRAGADNDNDGERQEFLSVRKHLFKNLDQLIQAMPLRQLIIMEESKDETERESVRIRTEIKNQTDELPENSSRLNETELNRYTYKL